MSGHKKLTVLDLFSGIGGFSLGLERTGGFETTAFCEIDPFCRKVLHKHWPGVLKFNDIKNLRPEKDDYDVICGGWPCQGNSVAGKLKGSEDERSGLWKEYYRIIKKVSPRWVIAENVSNVRNTQLAEVIKDLWKIGYDCEWYIIPASALGAPHQRERLWLIAYPNGTELRQQSRWECRESGEEKVLFERVSETPSYTREPRLQRYIQEQISLLGECEKKVTEFGDRIVPSFGEFRNWFARSLRVSDGFPSKLDKNRISACGNAVIPQIPELIGRAILDYVQ